MIPTPSTLLAITSVIGVGGFSASVSIGDIAWGHTHEESSCGSCLRPQRFAGGSIPPARISSTAFMSAKCHGRSGGMKALFKLLIVHAPFKYGVWV